MSDGGRYLNSVSIDAALVDSAVQEQSLAAANPVNTGFRLLFVSSSLGNRSATLFFTIAKVAFALFRDAAGFGVEIGGLVFVFGDSDIWIFEE